MSSWCVGCGNLSTYIPGVPIRRFFWPVPVFGGKPKNSERHFGVIFFCFGVVFLYFGVASFVVFSTSSLCHVFGQDPKKTPNGGPGIYCLAVFFLHQRFTSFISVPKELGLWFHMAVVHNSILKKAVDEELSLNELWCGQDFFGWGELWWWKKTGR